MKPSFLTILPASLLCLSGDCLAGASAETTVIESPPPASGWEFRVEPYGWLTGLEGRTGFGPFVTDIDQSFSDIFDNLEMAAALQLEARNGRFGIIADGFYAELGGSGSTPGPVYDTVETELTQFIGELAVAWRIYERPNGFVDVYAGMRYNDLSLDFKGELDPAGIQSLSERASDRIVSGIEEKAASIVGPQVDAFKSATAAGRTAIEEQLTAAIEAEAEGRVKKDLKRQLVRIRRDEGFDRRDIATNQIARAVKTQRFALARTTAQLEVARLRASVDASLQGKVTQAQSRVDQAEKKLSAAINDQLTSRFPTETSADKNWVDPIIGVRAQWNFNDKWFLAGKSDIGGFGVGSDLTWTVQATAGYQFTDTISAEIGYRYMDTDYQDGAFIYDIAESGIYTGLSFRF
jgi:hypothetical protein